MCYNDECNRLDDLNWLFTKRFRDFFYLICRKQSTLSQNFCYSHSLNFYLSNSTLSVSKQPTQLIIAAHNCHNYSITACPICNTYYVSKYPLLLIEKCSWLACFYLLWELEAFAHVLLHLEEINSYYQNKTNN